MDSGQLPEDGSTQEPQPDAQPPRTTTPRPGGPAGSAGRVCGVTHGDCDGDPDNGCETPLDDPDHCGACGNACSASSPLCVETSSGAFLCSDRCGTSAPTRCGNTCVNTDTSVSHCGGCNRPCDPNNAIGACVAGQCRIQSCLRGEDCNRNAADGCEADLDSPETCGGCNTKCPNARPFCRNLQCTDGCSDGVRNGGEAGVDCGGGLCPPCTDPIPDPGPEPEPEPTPECSSDGDCGGLRVCQGGTCVDVCPSNGVCRPASETQVACGNCDSGQARAVCNNACQWDVVGACLGASGCRPGDIDSEPCTRCGSRRLTCNASCEWVRGTCEGQGECTAGATLQPSCGFCGHENWVCTDQCQWNKTSCIDPGECDRYSKTNDGCPHLYQERRCSADCQLSLCRYCTSTLSDLPRCSDQACPSGYHISHYYQYSACSTGYRKVCRATCGDQIQTCSTCPTGYREVSSELTSLCRFDKFDTSPRTRRTCRLIGL